MLKLILLILGIAVLNIVVLSPGFMGVTIGENALNTAIGVTLLFASALALGYGSYNIMLKRPAAKPVKRVITHEDYIEALNHYRSFKTLAEDIDTALEQLDRMRKKKETLRQVLVQRFEPGELSYAKFSSVTEEVEKVFYLNIRSILNRLSVFDENEFKRAMNPKPSKFSSAVDQQRSNMYAEYLAFIKSSLATNEEILLKIDRLLLEISRLDSFELGDIENMACMQEIDSLIKQTKLYNQ